MIKNKINNIMQQLVQIETYIEHDEVKAEYKHSLHLRGLIKNNNKLFFYEYDDDVIRTEAYASMLEALYKAVKDLNIEEKDISINNKRLMKKAYRIAEYKMKEHLYPNSKVDYSDGSYEILATEVDGVNSYEETLNDESIKQYEQKEVDNVLYGYIERHKEEILTKKQQKYLEERLTKEHVNIDAETDRQMRRRIEKRINNSLNDLRPAAALINDRNTIIDSIINADDFRTEYSKYQDEDFVIDAVLEIDSDTRRAFNRGSNNESVIMKYKRALIKAKE